MPPCGLTLDFDQREPAMGASGSSFTSRSLLPMKSCSRLKIHLIAPILLRNHIINSSSCVSPLRLSPIACSSSMDLEAPSFRTHSSPGSHHQPTLYYHISVTLPHVPLLAIPLMLEELPQPSLIPVLNLRIVSLITQRHFSCISAAEAALTF